MTVKTILAAIGFIVVFLGICAGMGWCALYGMKEMISMSNKEKILIETFKHLNNKNSAAVVLATFIQVNGPLSEEAGVKVRELLEDMQ